MGGTDKRNGAGRKETLDPVIEKDRKSGNTVSLGRNAFRMIVFRILAVSLGHCPAYRETYWITDNLGMDMAITEGVYKRGK